MGYRLRGRFGFTATGVLAIGLCATLLLVSAPAHASGTSYRVSFTETGLPQGEQWTVILNGVVHASHTSTVTFSEPVGTYAFRILHHASYQTSQASGTVHVTGPGASVAITFTPLGTSSSIVSNFNGTSIPGGDWIWFNSVEKPKSSIPTGGLNLRAVGQTIRMTLPGGSVITLQVPDAKVSYGPAMTTGTTTFQNRWITNVPESFTDNVFLAGLAYHVPSGGLPGGIQSVNWTATFSVNSHVAFSFQWQWGAAVYSNFTDHYDLLKVKPLHSTSLDSYHTGDQAGTPEAFTAYVVGGARGGGGSNATGSYSATVSVTPKFVNN